MLGASAVSHTCLIRPCSVHAQCRWRHNIKTWPCMRDHLCRVSRVLTPKRKCYRRRKKGEVVAHDTPQWLRTIALNHSAKLFHTAYATRTTPHALPDRGQEDGTKFWRDGRSKIQLKQSVSGCPLTHSKILATPSVRDYFTLKSMSSRWI